MGKEKSILKYYKSSNKIIGPSKNINYVGIPFINKKLNSENEKNLKQKQKQ